MNEKRLTKKMKSTKFVYPKLYSKSGILGRSLSVDMKRKESSVRKSDSLKIRKRSSSFTFSTSIIPLPSQNQGNYGFIHRGIPTKQIDLSEESENPFPIAPKRKFAAKFDILDF